MARGKEAQSIDLPASIIKSIRGSAEKVRETFGNDANEWLIIEDAADKIGVPVWRVREWRRNGLIPYRRIGQRLEFKISVCDELRELRNEHGDRWVDLVSWGNIDDGAIADAEQEESSDQSESIAAKIMIRAKKRYAAGDYAGSSALFMAAIEDCGLMGD